MPFLKVHRFPAVDGRELSSEEILSKSNSLAAFLQPRGVIGCYLSHRKFWQNVVDNDLEYAIVFEDDVQLVPNFKQLLVSQLKNISSLPDKNSQYFDVLLLGAIGRVHPEGKDGVGTRMFSYYIGGKRPLNRISENLYQPRRPAVSEY